MEVKKGYKKTEVGVIPEDWDVRSLNELFTFNGGLTASRAQLSTKGICYLHYGDIHKSVKTFIDVSEEFAKLPKLDIPEHSISKNVLLYNGDVVFVDASEDDEGANKHIVVRNKEGIPFVSGLHTIVSKAKDSSLDNLYKEFCFQSDSIKRQFKFYSAGTKVCGVSKGNIVKMLLSIPPLSEQQAIAEALSDIDGLIGLLTKLIDKKKSIKQGAMQELLTGKKRLEGFSSKWMEENAGNLGNAYGGLTGKTKESFGRGSSKYIPFMNIMSNPIVDITQLEHVSIEKGEFQNEVRYGDLFFNTSSETPEEVGMCSVLLEDVRKVYLNSFCFGVRLNNLKKINPLFLTYLFRSNVGRNLMFSLAQGATRYNLSKSNFYKLKIKIPEYNEQTAIANILSDMDAEIEALEKKLHKYKAIKKGMMQELLTGRIRLVEGA